MNGIYTVKQVNSYIKNMFTQDFMLNRIYVKGEISNCKYHPSGHIYFSLKDESGTIACVMFAGSRAGLSFTLKNGQRVIAFGSVSVYERDGKYQLYAREIKLDGAGELYEKFEALKRELCEMGMFSDEYKQRIPAYVKTVGIVTAQNGAAVRDIINVAKRRNPYVQLILYPALVQGEGAVKSIIRGIRMLEQQGVDVMIVGRGGGSIEDLWNFNEETVARAIYECTVPVISAVGHDTDFTIADFAADLRAPTPTAAAELATPDGPEWLRKLSRMEQALHASARHSLLRSKLKLDVYLRGKLLDAYSLLSPYSQRLDDMEETLQNAATTRIFHNALHINKLEHQLQMRHPAHRNRERTQLLASLQAGLSHAAAARMTDLSSQLTLIQARLEAHSPEQTLRRGYALVENQDKQLIRQTNQVHAGEKLKIRVSDGCFYVRDDTPQ